MVSFIGIRVWIGRGFQHGQADLSIMDIAAVFAVIQYTDSVTIFTDIQPFVRAYLKSCLIPGSIIMCRAFYISILDLISCLICMDIDREICTEKDFFLIPVDLIADIDLAQITVKIYILHNGRFQILPFKTHTCANRSLLFYRNRSHIIYFPCFLSIIIVDIPCIIIVRTVFIAHDHIALLPCRKKFTVCLLIIDAGKLSLLIPCHMEKRCLCMTLIHQEDFFILIRLFHNFKGCISLGWNAVYNCQLTSINFLHLIASLSVCQCISTDLRRQDDRCRYALAVRVEDHHIPGIPCDRGRQASHKIFCCGTILLEQFLILFFGFLIDFFDRRTRKNIMELVAKQYFPHFMKFAARIFFSCLFSEDTV